MDDTHPAVRKVQFNIYRRMSAEEKVRLIDEMRRIERMLARTGIERRHPELTPEEVEFRLHEMFLGKELAARAYGRTAQGPKR
jgi:hypothetical protein